MREGDLTGFEARLGGLECSDELRSIVSILRAVAEEDDPGEWLSIVHGAGGGWGIRYRRGRNIYCRIDPKPTAGHVCVCIPGAEETALNAAGRVHRRKNDWSWVDVADAPSARRLADEIRSAYRRAG